MKLDLVLGEMTSLSLGFLTVMNNKTVLVAKLVLACTLCLGIIVGIVYLVT